MFVIYYQNSNNTILALKSITHSIYIGGNMTKKYILDNVKQYKTHANAQKIAVKKIKSDPTIEKILVVEYEKFVTYIDNLTCKCGCNVTINPIGGACYNIPNIGVIRPSCYDKIVPLKARGSFNAIKIIENFISDGR